MKASNLALTTKSFSSEFFSSSFSKSCISFSIEDFSSEFNSVTLSARTIHFSGFISAKPPDTKKDFNKLADDFDKRVQKTRNFYDLKDSQLRDSLEKWKKNFIELSGRIIQPIMLNYRAFIVLDSSQIDLFFDNRIDITELVILELDSLYRSDPKYLEIIIGK